MSETLSTSGVKFVKYPYTLPSAEITEYVNGFETVVEAAVACAVSRETIRRIRRNQPILRSTALAVKRRMKGYSLDKAKRLRRLFKITRVEQPLLAKLKMLVDVLDVLNKHGVKLKAYRYNRYRYPYNILYDVARSLENLATLLSDVHSALPKTDEILYKDRQEVFDIIKNIKTRKRPYRVKTTEV